MSILAVDLHAQARNVKFIDEDLSIAGLLTGAHQDDRR